MVLKRRNVNTCFSLVLLTVVRLSVTKKGQSKRENEEGNKFHFAKKT